jgi:hypothetical protein
MNEKLFEKLRNELSSGAGYYEGYDDNDLAKFAELIVQECARACLAATEPGSSVHLVSVAYADAVRQHFGVEE